MKIKAKLIIIFIFFLITIILFKNEVKAKYYQTESTNYYDKSSYNITELKMDIDILKTSDLYISQTIKVKNESISGENKIEIELLDIVKNKQLDKLYMPSYRGNKFGNRDTQCE